MLNKVFRNLSLVSSILHSLIPNETETTESWFCVKVPVLSESKTLTQPKVSIEANLLTRIFFLDNFAATIKSEIEIETGRPSGMKEIKRPIKSTMRVSEVT